MDLNRATEIIKNSDRITVFTGAGISTASGIPDFRGENGLYRTVQKTYNLPSGETLFDIDYFDWDPRPFYRFTGDMYGLDPQPTRCHRLLARWEEEGRINLVITQNIDGLHQKGGTKHLLECHGTYDRGHCRACGCECGLDEYEATMIRGEVPHCSCGGVIKPDVVFFGENLPDEFYRLWENPPESDLILILGTSLNVHPASDLALKLLNRAPSLIVNRDATDFDRFIDTVIHGELEEFARTMEEYFRFTL